MIRIADSLNGRRNADKTHVLDLTEQPYADCSHSMASISASQAKQCQSCISLKQAKGRKVAVRKSLPKLKGLSKQQELSVPSVIQLPKYELSSIALKKHEHAMDEDELRTLEQLKANFNQINDEFLDLFKK